LGLGRSSYEKTFDSFFKYSLLKQKRGEHAFPVAISIFASVALKTQDEPFPYTKRTINENISYVSQVLLARKFSSVLSLQLTPTYIHRNTVTIPEDPHNIFAMGFGSRVKLNKRVSFNTEYYYAFDASVSIAAKNSLAFGIDIETGGHVFQLLLSNAITMIEKSFIAENTGDFFAGDIHFGFNISRTF
jgi:hypothetical protein